MIIISQTFSFLVNEYFTPERQKRCLHGSIFDNFLYSYHCFGNVISCDLKLDQDSRDLKLKFFFQLLKEKVIRFENTDKHGWAKKHFC